MILEHVLDSGLNVRQDIIKIQEENISRTSFHISHRNIFLDSPPRVIEIKTKLKQLITGRTDAESEAQIQIL